MCRWDTLYFRTYIFYLNLWFEEPFLVGPLNPVPEQGEEVDNEEAALGSYLVVS